MLYRNAIVIVLSFLILPQAWGNWTEKLNLSGDFRYRHENRQDGENNRHRVWHNIRARLDLQAQLNEAVDAKMRFTSGTGSPRGTNQGLTDSFTKKDFNLSRAFFVFKVGEGSEFWAGKMAQPFFKAGKSDLIWDHDVSPEGGAIKYNRDLSESLNLFASAYNFWLQENKTTEDVMLYGGQLGLGWKSGDQKLNFVVGSYNYNHIRNASVLVDTGKPWGNTATGTVTASGTEFTYDFDYRLMNVGLDYSFMVGSLPLTVYVDSVSNSGVDEEGNGMLFGIGLGNAKAKGDWKLTVNSRELEADSAVAAFTDADFAGGNTDSKGIKVKIDYMLYDEVKLGLAHFDTEYNVSSNTPTEFSKTQLEVFAKF